ncbi:uncharacterized protein [Manis javanica]|uniref:uncharacterized protein isoform X1 n=1 Tax=Manis javanica TaxID=9974 RepID=UPI003C6D77B1
MDMPTYWILVTTMERLRGLVHLDGEATGCCAPCLTGYGAHHQKSSNQDNKHLSHHEVGERLDPNATEWHGQTSTLVIWGTHLQQHSALSNSPLSGELQHLLGPVTYTSGKQKEFAFEPLVAKSPYQERKAAIPEDAHDCINGSSHGPPPKRRAAAFHPKTETIWMEDGEGNSSEWAELWAVWLVTTQEISTVVVCTDSGAVYRGLTLWLLTRVTWMAGHQPLWGQELWQDLRASGQIKTVTVYHVTGQLPLASPANDEADTLSQVRWQQGKPASDVAQWLHQCLLHVGQKTMRAVTRHWGLLLTFEEVSRARKECFVSSKSDLH